MNSDDFLLNIYSLQQYEESQRDAPADAGFAKEALAVAIKEKLSDKQRECFLAYYVEGLTITEIAECRGVSKSDVSRLIGKARKRIWDVMRFTSRRTLHADMPKQNDTDGRHVRKMR